MKATREKMDHQARKTAAGAALLALAFLQLALASHQFDHVAGDIAETCQVCVQLERADDGAAVPDTGMVTAFAALAPARQGPEIHVPRPLAKAFDSRAPPKI